MLNISLQANISVQVNSFRGIVTYEQYIIFLEWFCVYSSAISALGIVTNAINIKAFMSMGLDDGVTVSFLALSFSDLFYLVATLIRAVASGFYLWEENSGYKTRFPVQPYAIYIMFANVGILLYVNTVLITTFLAVARCMCVAKPLHFKNAFTKSRSIWILTAFAIFTVFSYIPILYYMGIFNQYDPHTKTVRPCLWISPDRELAKDIVWGIRDTCLAFVTQFVVAFCVVVMARSLRQAAKFRQASASTSVPHDDPEVGKASSKTNSKKDASKLGGKDLQVVQQIALISFVYIVCNMPKIMVTASGFVEDELTLGKRYNNLYVIIVSLTEAFQMVNSSINVFIYYKFNSKFRSCCKL